MCPYCSGFRSTRDEGGDYEKCEECRGTGEIKSR